MVVSRLTMAEINELDRDAFVAALGSLFEGSPWIAAETWPEHPFSDIAQLHAVLCRVMHEAPPDRQVALIRGHPDLVGRAALAGTLTPESTREQAAAGLDRLTPEEIAAFTRYNQAYNEKFGFPFVICARENRKDSILAGFERRLGNTRQEEIAMALGEIAKINYLRLRDAVSVGDES